MSTADPNQAQDAADRTPPVDDPPIIDLTANDPPANDPPAIDLPGLSMASLERWLRSEHPGLTSAEPLSASLLPGGRSNLTYLVRGGPSPFVLRRPPLGHVQTTAHDMAREFRIISALAPTSVPVPKTLMHRDDTDGAAGVGTPFYLMEYVEGAVLSSPAANSAFDSSQLHRLGLDLVTTLADLHAVDAPSVGLGDFGRPDGFLERQIRRWGAQYDGSRNRHLPQLDALQHALQTNVPETVSSSLVHGDFRLDNAIIRNDVSGRPRVAAILDWEMSTIGDSFSDLGLFGLYWDIRSIGDDAAAVAASAVDPAAGYASFAELTDAYAARRGTVVPDLSWYLAFAAYKLAIILEGIHFRYRAGDTVGPGFDTIGSLVTPLAAAGLRSLKQQNSLEER